MNVRNKSIFVALVGTVALYCIDEGYAPFDIRPPEGDGSVREWPRSTSDAFPGDVRENAFPGRPLPRNWLLPP